MNDSILDLLSRMNITSDDVEDGTAGWCGTFALTLMRFLRENGVNAEIVLCHDGYYRGKPAWAHVALLVDNELYDIEGRLSWHKIAHYYYMSSLTIVTEVELIQSLRTIGIDAYSWKKMRGWLIRMRAAGFNSCSEPLACAA